MIGFLKLLMVENKEFYTFLRKQLKINPRNVKLYELAFLHRSASLTLADGSVVNNERLEFLGDAVIDAVIADYLFRTFPQEREGFLTRMRSKIVNRVQLDLIASEMGLIQAVVSHGTSTETLKKRICGEALEALIGAMYIDKGYKRTRKYITNHILEKFTDLNQLMETETDFKSRLIEWGQKNKLQVEFETIEKYYDKSEKGLLFSVRVIISTVPIAKGKGKSKKEAEQMASQKALDLVSASTDDLSAEALLQYLRRNKKKQKKMCKESKASPPSP